MTDAESWKERMREKHERFWKEFGGKVFVVFSVYQGKKKFEVVNKEEVIRGILEEVKRLTKRIRGL